MARKRTIADIAQLAGVSKATVSRVLNHKPDVDPSTRERILRIMEEEDFVPNVAASGLAGGRSRLIGILIPSLTWPFIIPDIIRGVTEVVGNTMYELVLYSVNDKVREGKKGDVIDHILSTDMLAALLAILPGHSSPYMLRLHQVGCPVVLIDDQGVPPAEIPWVGVDNRGGGYLATRHLLQLGHTRIAHIHGPTNLLCCTERYQGYVQALQEAGLAVDPDLVQEGNFEVESGQTATHAFLSLPVEKRPTAIFSANDQMAYGVIVAVEDHGLRVPDDIALVGFDDIYSSVHVRPALTTIKQPFSEMGQYATEALLSMLNHPSERPEDKYSYLSFHRYPFLNQKMSGRGANEPVRIQLATSLVVRASCGAKNVSKVVSQ